MELPSSKCLTSPTRSKFPANYPDFSKNLGIKFRYLPLIASSNKSTYQDFQEYAKPSRLLPARGLRLLRDASSLENVLDSFSSNKFGALYKVRLQTSNIYGSGLTDVNSGILLCLIDENGSSILQRLPASDGARSEELRFQRGSIDEFAFEGPHLGRILALWISLESGEWRIGGLNLRVISAPGEKNQEIKQLTGLQYEFEFEDILLGEKGEASMMEFRPHSVTSFSFDESTLFSKQNQHSSPSYPASNEESMREYAYLKFSLLFYDTVLTLAGSAVASVSIGENAAYAFLLGGLLGFAYLLLLQRSVDELPTRQLSENEGSGSSLFGNLKGSVSIVGLVFALVVVAAKYGYGDYGMKLASKDIILGMMGFLMSKVSVVLAAFKPMTRSFRENE